MQTIEKLCVDCGLPCLGSGCPHQNTIVTLCDKCGDYAAWSCDGQDLCEDCLEEFLNSTTEKLSAEDEILWADMGYYEKAEALDYSIERL